MNQYLWILVKHTENTYLLSFLNMLKGKIICSQDKTTKVKKSEKQYSILFRDMYICS